MTQEFSLQPKILFNENSIESIKDIDCKNVFIVTDSIMKQLGFVDKIIGILNEKEIKNTVVFSDVKPDPDIAMITQGMNEMDKFEFDAVIAVGGGSVIDACKAIMYCLDKLKKSKGQDFNKPTFVAVPSTSGTGSEVTAFSVIKIGSEKLVLVDEWMLPDIAILDPIFVKSVPNFITADTGMDVLCHALEAYVSTNASDFTDALSEKAVKLVFKYLVEAYKDGNNKEAREKMHSASCMAGIAFTNASLGINHSLAHSLGGIFKIAHGRANALLLPHIVEYNSSMNKNNKNEVMKKYANIARELNLPAVTDKQGVQSLIRAIKLLKDKMNMPKSIKDLNIDINDFKNELDTLSTLAINDSCTPTNPIEPTLEDIKDIYMKVYEGK